MKKSCIILLSLLLSAICFSKQSELQWWKGYLHAHSYWSDGDQMPELVIEWFKTHGYHFLALSEHDRPPVEEYFKDVAPQDNPEDAWMSVHPDILKQYQNKYGSDWVQTRMVEDKLQVRLKPLSELAALFNESQKFLLMPSQEIYSLVKYEDKEFSPAKPGTAHINLANSYSRVYPDKGNSPLEAMQKTIDNMLKYGKTCGQQTLISLNHPNYMWGCVAEDIALTNGLKLMEIYTALSFCNSNGDNKRASAERMWDIVLTKRLAELDREIVYGMASDDCHTYEAQPGMRNWGRPGRGWIMVRSRTLTPESLITAINHGDFYGSSGVILNDIKVTDKSLSFSIQKQPGITYKTQFIGTKKGYNPSSMPVLDETGNEMRTTQIYSSDIGEILAERKSRTPQYNFTGDEIYVRAKVESSKKHPDPSWPGQLETAWTQPVVPHKIKN